MENTPPPNPNPPPAADMGAVYGESGMKKKILSIVIGLVVVVFLIIFGVVVYNFVRPKTTGPVTLTYWGLWEDQAVFNDVIQEYKSAHPNVTIKYEKMDPKNAPGGYIGFLDTRVRKGTGPDIYRFHTSWIQELNQKQLLAPLPADVVKEIGLKDDFYPVASNGVMSSNAYFGVPLGIDTLVLYVNDELLKAGGYSVPQDWNSLIDTARALTVVDDQTGEIKNAGIALGTFDNIAHAGDIISLLITQNKVNVAALAGFGDSDPDKSKQLQATAKAKMVEALNFYTCFAQDSDICKAVWNQDMPNSKLAFVEGKLAMYFGYSWDLLEIKRANPDLKFSMHPVPKLGSTGESAGTLGSFWAEGVSSQSQHQKEAFDFLTFLSKQESLEKIYKNQASQRVVGVAYPRKEMGELLKDNPFLGAVIESAPRAYTSAFYSDTFDGALEKALDLYIGNAVNSVITEGSNRTSVESAVDTLANGMKSAYTQYVLPPTQSSN